MHGSLPIPPVSITSLIQQQGGIETRPMEVVKGTDGWEDDSIFGRSYGSDDPFSPVPFHKLLKEKYHGMEWSMIIRICLLIIDNQI